MTNPNPIPIALSLLMTAAPATAQDSAGYYAKLFAGTSLLQDGRLSFASAAGTGRYDTGFGAGGAIGYDYGNRPFRAEIEFAYRTADADSLPAGLGSGGDFASTSLMLNGYYMFRSDTDWTPYLGLGVGAVTEIDFDVTGGGEFTDSGGFAWQLMAGAEYELTDGLALYGEARYFVADGPSLTNDAGTRLDADYDTLDLNLGIAFRF